MKNNRLLAFFIISLIFSSAIYAQNSKLRFIKGNLQDKTAAVREASGDDAKWLTQKAFDFVLENKTLLGDDRDLEGLAVAAVLSIPNDYGTDSNENERLELSKKLIQLFNDFSSSNTVQISILSKYLSLRNILPTDNLTSTLNEYINSPVIIQNDAGVVKSIINTLGYIGNNVSFTIIYNLLNDKRFVNFYPELEQSLTNLLPVSMNEAIKIVRSGDTVQMRRLFDLVQKNKRISSNFLSEIAENVLNESIIIVGNSSEVSDSMVLLQMDSISVLSENKWTRASAIAVSFFNLARKEYNAGAMNEVQMVNLINQLVNVAPVASVAPLIAYLEDLNGRKEIGKSVSQDIVLAVINTLGAIGDKSAFDSLLEVTYLDYREDVLLAARNALAGLRW